jgi:hypothetical protein
MLANTAIPVPSPPRAGFFVSCSVDINDNTYVSRHAEATLHTEDADQLRLEMELSKLIFEKLWSHYPRRDWRVLVDIPQGIVKVQLPRLHHSTLGFNFPLEMLSSDPNMTIVMRAGGTILEHLNLGRGRFNQAEYTDAIKNRPVAFTKHDWNGALAADKHTTVNKRRLVVPEHLKFYQPSEQAVNDNGGSVEAAILAYARETGIAA